MSYNVMSGGFDSYSSDFKITTRVDNLKKIITRTGADIVSLVDTFKWDEIYSIDKLKEMFGYSNAYCINLDDQRLRKIGHNNGITVFSGIDNVSFETISLRTRNCVKTTVKINEVEYDIFSLYLDDLSEDVRLEQIGHLVHYFEKNKPTVIVGDLNTINPKDSSKSLQRINDFLKNNPKFETFRKQLEDMHRSEVITKLLKMGFQDSNLKLINTFPTKLTLISDKPILRIDYCLFRNCKVKRFKVMSSDLLDKTSDHFPIVAKL